MSKRYKGAVISATPPTTSTSSASGVWTEQQFMQGVASGSWPALAGAPTIGTATAGALSASVTFTAPTYVGSGITGYTATSSPGGITGTGASSPVTVSGLTAGTAYTFTVTATTAAGQGPASAASNSVTPTNPNYIEDVFSTYLYTGNNSTQTINNGIDLAGKGGLTWIKVRDYADSHRLFDTSRGVGKYLVTNGTFAETTNAASVTAFNSNGFSLGDFAGTNGTAFGSQYASWTFRKQPKFFDVVTYTGNSANGQAISHNLGSVPGCIITKSTSNTRAWWTYHRSTSDGVMALNTTAAKDTAYAYSYFGNDTILVPPTSTQFTVGYNSGMNQGGETYVAYLFAHDAGGFGLTGTDNVISCGSVSVTNSTQSVSVGYEPQWILWKKSSGIGSWWMFDTMRGLVVDNGSGTGDKALYAELSNAETGTYGIDPTATGFQLSAGWGAGDYIYIAIRRGPMKVPTSGTSVYNAVSRTGTSANATVTGASFAPDITVIAGQSNSSGKTWVDKLRGPNKALLSAYTNAEQTTTDWVTGFTNTGFTLGADASGADYVNKSPKTYINWMFGRAPSFFDEVCYTGTGSATTFNHNLTVVPEMMIVKSRSGNVNWAIYTASTGATKWMYFGTAGASTLSSIWNDTAPTSAVFTVGSASPVNDPAATYVAYLFATCAGVSKVGSYTGNGSTQTINCGFTGGARFVLIKRTDSTGDWYTYDSTRGITSGNDPYLFLNTTDPEDTGTNYVDTDTTGFKVTAAAPTGLNASGGTYIFLAIA